MGRKNSLNWLQLVIAALFSFLFLSAAIGVIDFFDSEEKRARICLKNSHFIMKNIGAPQDVELVKRFYFSEAGWSGNVHRKYLYIVKGSEGQVRIFVEINKQGECKVFDVISRP